jgi:indolepyruvate ferredoxin oxidoreductase alpha subunit
MSNFREIVDAPEKSKFILQGNRAFALGVVHAGYHTADGYPGTPSTEVIDKSLAFVQDKINVGWSVNEAVAIGVGVGHAIAGYDSLVTMKIPGVFQAGDAISTSAFYTAEAGALVIFAATDYVPSSTQHVIDSRYFFASARLPVLEPRNHQEMYEIAWIAADMSRQFNTPVVVLASGILAHSEGLVKTCKPRTITPKEMPENLHSWMLMPAIARLNYDRATQQRIPEIQGWIPSTKLVTEIRGSEEWGIIVSGESSIIVLEALSAANLTPSILTTAISNPIPDKQIKAFTKKIRGKLFVIEDGDTFLQERLQLLDNKLKVVGKEKFSTITHWQPERILGFLSQHLTLKYERSKKVFHDLEPLKRPPSICPGCPYKAFALAVSKLKKQKKIYASFGDIGCSTLLYFLNALDTVMCMGGADSMRQGFVLSRPEMASKTISVIGDSCECHSGMDSTRNAVFRNVPGVKVILDNKTTAMTGGQPAPSSDKNLANQPHKFRLKNAIKAEVKRTRVVDAYNLKEVDKELRESLKRAEKGIFSAIILEGLCVQQVDVKKKQNVLQIDYDKCKRCGLCNICPGISVDDDNKPFYTSLCTNCGSNFQVCRQCCPFGAIVPAPEKSIITPHRIKVKTKRKTSEIGKKKLPESIRVAIRGIGGQGNLFFGRILSDVAMKTPYSENHIVKGDTHGMAQLGGSVISTFSCGKVYSPILAPHSADVLVAMEVSEILRPGFIDLLKPEGVIIINRFEVLPVNTKREAYPSFSKIKETLKTFKVIEIDAHKMALSEGDKSGRAANVVVLGLLSSIKPLSLFPEEAWISSLVSLSANDFIRDINLKAFKAGRDYNNI